MAILNEYGYPYQVPQKFAHSADRNPARGVVYRDRPADIDRLITAQDSKTIRSLAGRLYANVGVLKGAIDQKADYTVGDAWLPTYTGESDFSDGKQIATFMRKVWFPNCNVKGGVFDWAKTLELASIALDRDGDQFWLKVVGADGFPRIQVIPAHRVGSAGDSKTVTSGKFIGLKISDGVILYKSGRPAGYRVLLGDDLKDFTDYDAADVIHILDPDYCEQNRGISKFNHALQDLKACLASTEDERIRQQIVSRLHLTIFNESGGPDLDDPMNITVQTVNADGTAGQFVAQQSPGGIVYMTAGGGEKIEQMKHDSPGDMWENFQDRMIRMSLAPCWSYSIWKGSGQGTDARAEVVKCRRFVTKRNRDLRRPALAAFAWAYSVFQQANRVPLLDHPFSWEFSKPPRLSVDDGRESKMEVEEWRAGLRNTDEIAEARGMTATELHRKRAYIIADRKIVARQVAEEMSASSGYEIEIEDREMAMLTPNEVAPVDPAEMVDPTDPNADPNQDPNQED